MATTVTETTTGGETVTGGGATTRKTLYDSTGYPSGLVTTTTPSVTTFTPAEVVDPNKTAETPIAKTDEDVAKGYKVEITGIGELTQDDAAPPPQNTGHQGQSTITVGDAPTTTQTPPPTDPTIPKQQKSAPGARTFNPLSMFSSYTYHITLYMITPYSYNKFIEQGNKGISPKDMFVVAESGGTNVNGKNKRLFDLDFYIDDFSFQTYLSTNATKGANVDSLSFSFKIVEPFGFSFMSALKAAALKVVGKSDLPGHDKAKHHLQQLYMIGIKFYGYDADGNLVTDDTTNQLIPNTDNGSSNDQFADNGVFARYFPINITEMQFRLDGKATVYNFKAINVSVNTGNGVKHNQVKTSQSLTGKTVEELLSTGENSLEKLLNKIQEDQFPKEISVKNVFKIKFNKGENSKIKDSILTTGKASDRNKSAMSGSAKVTDSSKANDKTAQTAKPDNNTRTFEIPAGTSITQVIERVIAQSSYITDALTAKGNEDMEDWSDEAKAADRTRLEWFVITPVCKMLAFDPKVNDFAYEITYIINEYKIPRVRSAYVSEPTPYHGAHKIYEYWFTGKNSEVLSYEQKYNGLFYMDALENPNPDEPFPNSSGLTVPIKPGSKQNADDSGLFDKAGQMIASVRTSLYSPGEQAMATIQILGDPDFICTTVGMNYNVYDENYGPDKSVDPHAGQVFVQIVFNEGVDYDHDVGMMNLKTNIMLYDYPKYLKDTKGIIYSATDVVSTFSKGRFTQELHLVMYSPPPDKPDNKSETAREVNSLASRYPAPTKGLTPDEAAKTNEPTVEPASTVDNGSTPYSADVASTNNSILGTITGGRVKVANETNLSATSPQNVVQGPNDDNPGYTVSSNIENEGRTFA
jgi:hypothetical protein